MNGAVTIKSEFDLTREFFAAHPDGSAREAARHVYRRVDSLFLRYVELNAHVLRLPQADRLRREVNAALLVK